MALQLQCRISTSLTGVTPWAELRRGIDAAVLSALVMPMSSSRVSE